MFGNIGDSRLSSVSAPQSAGSAVTQTVEMFQIAQLADSVRKARANNTYGTYNNSTYDPNAGLVLTENTGTKQTLDQIIGFAESVEAGHTPILVDIYGIVPTSITSSGAIITGIPAGHTLLPYRADDAGGGVFRVYVYDPNYPHNTDCYIEMNPAQGTWAYMVHFNNVRVWESPVVSGVTQGSASSTGNTTNISILWGTSAQQFGGHPFHLIDYVTVDDILSGMNGINADYQKQAIVSGYAGVTVEAAGGGAAGIREYIVPGMTADSALISPYRMFDIPASGAYTFSFYGDNYTGTDGASVCLMDGNRSISVKTDDADAAVTLDAKNAAASITSDEMLTATVSYVDMTAGCEINVTGQASGGANLFVTAGILQIDGFYGDVIITAVNSGQTVTAARTLDGAAVAFDIKDLEQRDPISVVNPISIVFRDVQLNAWYYSPVMNVYGKGLMVGTSVKPMLFSPNTPLTRGMVVTVLYRMAGSPDTSGLTNPFDDVAAGQWYTDAVIWAAERGIVNGYGGGRYGPEDNVTREQLTVILNNYAGYAGISLPSSKSYTGFNDEEDIADYAKDAVESLFETGIIGGYPDGSFKPRGEATRAEFAAILQRFIEIL